MSYKYNPATNQVEENPTMEKPEWTGKMYMGSPYITGNAKWEAYKDNLREYEHHLTQLHHYDCIGFGSEHEGRELEVDVDFKLEEDYTKGTGSPIIAVAIAKAEERELFNENKLRKEIASKWGEFGAHIDVFDSIMKQNRIMLEELKRLSEKYGYILPEEVCAQPPASGSGTEEEIKRLLSLIEEMFFKLGGDRFFTWHQFKADNKL